MMKKRYQEPQADIELMLAQALICDSLSGGIDDYDLIGDYTWTEE